MTRNKVMAIRVTEEEKDRMDRLANRLGLSTTSMLVMLVNKEYRKEFGEDMKLVEGWNEMDNGLDIFVEDGKVLRGVKDNKTVYPYKSDPQGGYTNCIDLTIDQYKQLFNEGKLIWR